MSNEQYLKTSHKDIMDAIANADEFIILAASGQSKKMQVFALTEDSYSLISSLLFSRPELCKKINDEILHLSSLLN